MEHQKIFISYSRADGQQYAIDLAQKLRETGINIWLDQVDIEPGKIWDFEIEKALKAAEAVIFIATEKSTASNNVLNEVYYALEENKEVIPAIFHACSMPFRLKRLQYIDFTTDYDAAFKRLLKALNLPAADTGGDTQSIPESTQPPKEKPQHIIEEKEITAQPGIKTRMMETEMSLQKNEIRKPETKPAPGTDENKTGNNKKLWIGIVAAIIVLAAIGIYFKNASNKSDTGLLQTTVVTKDSLQATAGDSSVAAQKKTAPNNRTTHAETKAPPVSPVDESKKDNDKNTDDIMPADDAGSNGVKGVGYYFNSGMNNIRRQKYLLAVQNFDEVIKLKPDAYKAYFQAGNASLALKHYRQALAYYNHAIELNPNSNAPAYYYGRGTVNLALNNKAAACADFKHSADLGDQRGAASYNQSCPVKK